MNTYEWLEQLISEHHAGARVTQEIHNNNYEIPEDPGYVYAMHARGTHFFKFGLSKNPDRRLKQVYPKMPFETDLVATWPTLHMRHAENWMHKAYANQRVNGEWFELSAKDAYYLIHEDFSPKSINTSEDIKYAYALHFLSQVIGVKLRWINLLCDATNLTELYCIYQAVQWRYQYDKPLGKTVTITDSLKDLILDGISQSSESPKFKDLCVRQVLAQWEDAAS